MASSTERQQSVSVTLIPKDDPSDKRIIILAANKPLTIGRSSRSEPKNLAAGIANALFDNPVVSRKHAQLELNPSGIYGKEVTITDVGSMHGTWVNGRKLSTHAPFQLQPGDKIKFGDKVVRNYDAHDGLDVSVEIADAPLSNAASHVKPFTGSYKVPSDSEYDSDDMGSEYSHNDVDDEENTSSAHTTPEQAHAKPGSQQAPIDVEQTVSGINREVIDLASDEGLGDSNQPSKSRLKPGTTVIQDSYEDPSLRVADSYAGPQHSIFRPWQSRPNLDKEADRDEVESVMKHNTGLAALLGANIDGEDEFEGRGDDDVDEDDMDSADGSIMGEIDGFYDDQSDALDERDDDDLSASDASDIADVDSVSDDEGPEVFSSKRQMSPELGKLGQTDTAAAETYTNSIQTNNAAKLQYDPVRGSAPPSPAHAATASSNTNNIPSARPRAYASFPSNVPEFGDAATNYHDSSKWDVGPVTSQYYSIPHSGSCDYGFMYQDVPPKPSVFQPSVPPPFGYMTGQTVMPKFGEAFAPQQNAQAKPASKLDIMNLVEDRAAKIQERITPTGTKRKAEEMTEPQPEPTNVPSPLSLVKESPIEQTAPLASQTPPELAQRETSSMEVDQPHVPIDAVVEEPPKKKTKRTDTSTKGFFPAKEIAKAAGYMALGGAATIGFLVSDAAERLFS